MTKRGKFSLLVALTLLLSLFVWARLRAQMPQPPVDATFGNLHANGVVGLRNLSANGASYLNGVCRDGSCPVEAFGASGLGASNWIGSVGAGSSTLALASSYAGLNGTWLHLVGGGSDPGLAQPAAPVVDVGTLYVEKWQPLGSPPIVTPAHAVTDDVGVTDLNTGFWYQPNCPTPANYQYCLSGSTYTFNASASGANIVVKYLSASGQTGATHSYQLFAADDGGGWGPASPTATVTTVASLAPPDYDTSAFNAITNGTQLGSASLAVIRQPSLPANATKWMVCRDGVPYDWGEKIWLHASPASAPVLRPTWVDYGQSHQSIMNVDMPAACPTLGQPDRLITQVVAGAGTANLTISPAATSALTNGGSSNVFADDTNAFQLACSTLVPAAGGSVLGGIWLSPNRTYNLSSTVTCGATSPITARMYGMNFGGTTGINTSIIQWEGSEDAEILLFRSPYGGYFHDMNIVGAPSATGLTFETPAGGSSSNTTVERVQVTNASRYGFAFGRGTANGQLSEVTIRSSTATGGGSGGWRMWAGFELTGANNLNYNFYNSGCGSVGVGNYAAQVNPGSCISTNGDVAYGNSSAGGNAWNWFGGSVSASPKYGIPCFLCGTISLGPAGTYNISGVRVEQSSNLVNLPSTGAPYEINLFAFNWANTIVSSTQYIVNIQSNNFNSYGSNWAAALPGTFNIVGGGAMRFVNDGFALNAHTTLQAWFAQTLGSTPNVQVTQQNIQQGTEKMANLGFSLSNSAAGTPLPTCNAALARTFAAVSDATSCTAGAAYAGGGSALCLEECPNAGTGGWKAVVPLY